MIIIIIPLGVYYEKFYGRKTMAAGGKMGDKGGK